MPSFAGGQLACESCVTMVKLGRCVCDGVVKLRDNDVKGRGALHRICGWFCGWFCGLRDLPELDGALINRDLCQRYYSQSEAEQQRCTRNSLGGRGV